MQKFSFFLFAGFLLPVLGHAQESCPWMNVATAAATLNTQVEVAITHPNPDHKNDITCVFTRQKHGTRELRIEVHTIKAGNELAAAGAACVSKPAVLKAVGNEALTCSLEANKQRVEQAFGRVRDRVFIAQIRTSDGAWATQDVLIDKASQAAELVAGNLF